jgi:hypothetical protein
MINIIELAYACMLQVLAKLSRTSTNVVLDVFNAKHSLYTDKVGGRCLQGFTAWLLYLWLLRDRQLLGLIVHSKLVGASAALPGDCCLERPNIVISSRTHCQHQVIWQQWLHYHSTGGGQ